jgi:NAD(P)-dependent dehydrogenase (short-subunit alcohol dehydrogenase family)
MITGAGSGIGAAVAVRMEADVARVVAHDVDGDAAGPRALVASVGDRHDCRRHESRRARPGRPELRAELGRLDVLANVAASTTGPKGGCRSTTGGWSADRRDVAAL